MTTSAAPSTRSSGATPRAGTPRPAQDRITAAATAAQNAAHRAANAVVAGPAGAGALAGAQADERSAAHARESADGDLRRARAAIEDAERDLRLARKDGEDANDDAERAGRAAAKAFADVRSRATPLIAINGPVEVPVSLRGSDPDAPGLNLGFGGPFHAPGRFGSPGDARAAQIAKARQAAADAAEADKPRKGSILDGLAGLVHSASMGTIDPGGDKDSDRYRGGDLAGYIPLTPGGVIKDVGKAGEKLGIRRAERKAAKEAEERAAAKAARKKAREDARGDRRPGESLGDAVKRRERDERELFDELAKQDFKRSTLTDVVDALSKGLNMLIEHRVPGLPEVLTEASKNLPTVKASALYLLELVKQRLRR